MNGHEFQSGANGTERLPTLRDIATPLFRHGAGSSSASSLGSTLLFGTLLGCLVSAGIAFAVDCFDPSFRTQDEVRDLFEIPMLATRPKSKGKRYVS
jgi:hypothetical protein